MFESESSLEKIQELLVNYAPKLVGGLLVLIIGLILVKVILSILSNQLEKRTLEPSLISFIRSLLGVILRLVVIISAIGIMGVQTTSFVAVLGAAGLAVGLALQGTLQNFASGVMILLFKPFKVGDVINGAGFTASVKEIQIFNTILKTPDNKIIIVPNSQLSNSAITNFSMEEKRRVDWTFGIGYGDKVEDAKGILMELIEADERIINDPDDPFIALSELGDSSVNLVVRCWVMAPDYWSVFFEMNLKVYNTFNEKGINIPFPQMDVHVINQ